MNRADFQQLADVRIDEAGALLVQGKFAGAYYLAGYAVECALKACIAKLTNQYDFPPDRRFVERCYSHGIEGLLAAANLNSLRDADAKANPTLAINWGIAKDWKETSRYEQQGQVEAQRLYDAITDNTNGVLPWIRQHW